MSAHAHDYDPEYADRYDDDADLEATAEQIKELIGLGIAEDQARSMSMADAADLLDELKSERDAAERFGRS